MLNETIKKALLKSAREIYIDVSQLDSYVFVKNIYGLEPHLAIDGYDWDENEEWKEQIKKLADLVEKDGLCEYAPLSDDEDLDGNMSLEAAKWLRSLVED